MDNELLFAATLAAVLGAGLIAGAFYIFSIAIMTSLGRLPAAHGIAAMQQINVTIINPLFMLAFMSTTVLSVALAVIALLNWDEGYAPYLLAAGLVYAIANFGVTMVFNVPRNDALARVEPESVEGAGLWSSYLSDWTAWNHVRTIAASVAVALFAIALTQ